MDCCRLYNGIESNVFIRHLIITKRVKRARYINSTVQFFTGGIMSLWETGSIDTYTAVRWVRLHCAKFNIWPMTGSVVTAARPTQISHRTTYNFGLFALHNMRDTGEVCWWWRIYFRFALKLQALYVIKMLTSARKLTMKWVDVGECPAM